MVSGKTITVETLEDHTYDGIPHKAGERYEAEEGHVDFLTLRGFARLATAAPAVPADPPPSVPSKPAARKK